MSVLRLKAIASLIRIFIREQSCTLQTTEETYHRLVNYIIGRWPNANRPSLQGDIKALVPEFQKYSDVVIK